MIFCDAELEGRGSGMCGKPAVQFILHHSHTIPGDSWATASCDAHVITGIILDSIHAQEMTEEEYVVYNVMRS